MAESKKYFLKSVYRYGRVSLVEGVLLDHAASFRNCLFSQKALDELVAGLKEKAKESLAVKDPRRPEVEISLEKRVTRSGIQAVIIKIGYHSVWLEAVKGEQL